MDAITTPAPAGSPPINAAVPSEDGGHPLSRTTLAWLALQDFRHERLLTVCHVLACAAALTPLLLIFGLWHGAIETLRTRLLQDPHNREIRPGFGQSFDRRWFEIMESRPDVAFLIPHIRQVSAGVEARKPDAPGTGQKRPWANLDVLPTKSGDPMLQEAGVGGLAAGQCVLSAKGAQETGAARGETVEIQLCRFAANSRECQIITRQVAGVMAPRATRQGLVLLPLEETEAVEHYKDGLSVPRLGWQGKDGAVLPRYDGLLVCGGTTFTPTVQEGLTKGTGLTRIIPLPGAKAQSVLGFPLPQQGSCFLLTAEGSLVGDDSVNAVTNRLQGTGHTARPIVLPRTAAYAIGDMRTAGRPVRFVGVPPDMLPAVAHLPQESNVPTGFMRQAPSGKTTLRFMAANAKADTDANGAITIPLSVESADVPEGYLWLPAPLAGQLASLRDRPLEYEARLGVIRPGRRGYPAFRLYTKTLKDVVKLDKDMRAAGIHIHAATDRIDDVLRLDRNLGILFWLIAAVAMIGGMFTLAASLYASIERKRREMGMLRLLGVPLGALSIFPITQGLLIAGAALAVSLATFWLTALVIDVVFAGHHQTGEHMCTMGLSHILVTTGMTLGLAALAGVTACTRIARQDPALTLRDE